MLVLTGRGKQLCQAAAPSWVQLEPHQLSSMIAACGRQCCVRPTEHSASRHTCQAQPAYCSSYNLLLRGPHGSTWSLTLVDKPQHVRGSSCICTADLLAEHHLLPTGNRCLAVARPLHDSIWLYRVLHLRQWLYELCTWPYGDGARPCMPAHTVPVFRFRVSVLWRSPRQLAMQQQAAHGTVAAGATPLCCDPSLDGTVFLVCCSELRHGRRFCSCSTASCSGCVVVHNSSEAGGGWHDRQCPELSRWHASALAGLVSRGTLHPASSAPATCCVCVTASSDGRRTSHITLAAHCLLIGALLTCIQQGGWLW